MKKWKKLGNDKGEMKLMLEWQHLQKELLELRDGTLALVSVNVFDAGGMSMAPWAVDGAY